MTYNELCEEVKALGFETEIESQERMLFAARRALRTIFTERPFYETAVIYSHSSEPSVKIERIDHKGGESDTLPYCARAYSFRTSGEGSYTVTESGEEKSFSFSGNNILHRGFLHGEGEINFTGDYSYTVYDIGFFDELYGESTASIPEASKYTEYDIRDFCDGFISFVSAPRDDEGKEIQGATLRNGIITIPSSYRGRFSVICKRFSDISGNPDETILLPDGCEQLLALLCAAYVWLDDDAEKAQYYMTLYREGMAAVRYYDRPHIENSYNTTNGWA